MEIKNLIKKGITIQSLLLTIVLGIFVIGGIYSFIQQNEIQAGLTPDPRFADMSNAVINTQGEIRNISFTFKSTAQAVTETNPGDFGYYGLKGLLSLMLLPFTIVGIVDGFINAISNVDSILPAGVRDAIILSITFIVIFAAIAFLTNRGKDST
jgi:hypothetical protein